MRLLHDTGLIFARSLRITLRNPLWMMIDLAHPLYFLILFAPLLARVAKMPGFPPGGAMNVFTPGLLMQLALYGTAFAGFGLITDLRAGVIERLRVTPVNRLALLLGRALRDIVILLVQSLLLVLIAWLFGLRVDLVGLALTLGLMVLLGLMMASCSYALALAVKSDEALASVLNSVTLPMMLLSGILLPLTLAPAWLRGIAALNPLAYAVDATRALFRGHVGDAAVLHGVAVLAVLAALAMWWGARSFRYATA